MRILAVLLVVFCLALPGLGAAKKRAAAPAKKVSSTASSAKKTTSQTAKKSTAPTRTAAKKTTKKSTKTARSRSRRTPSWRRGQMQPTSERYAEIQQALVDKGYAKAPVDGRWNQEWSESLKRFQRDQKIEASGKLTSLSLMGLGLGPRRARADAGTTTTGPPPDTTDREPQ